MGMFPQDGDAEALQDNIMIRVVPWVPDGYFPKDMAVHPKNFIRPGQHLLPQAYYAPGPAVLGP